jgi:hypothetical protein
MAHSLLRQETEGRRRFSRERLRSICGLCISLSLPMTYARFYSRSLYNDMSTNRVYTRGSSRTSAQCSLSHNSQCDSKAWRQLAKEIGNGRPIRPIASGEITHRSSRCRLGWDLECQWKPWRSRTVVRPRYLDMTGQGGLHFSTRIQGYTNDTNGQFRRVCTARGITVFGLCFDNTSAKFVKGPLLPQVVQ